MNTKDITNGARDFAGYMADNELEIVGPDGEPIIPNERVSYSLLARVEARKYFGVEFAVDDLRQAFITDSRFADIVEAMRSAYWAAGTELTLDSVFTALEVVFDSELELTDIELEEAFDSVDIEDVKHFLGTIMAILESCTTWAGEGYLESVIEKATIIAYDNLRWKGIEEANADTHLPRYLHEVEALKEWAKASMQSVHHT